MSGATEFLGLPSSYLEADPTSFVAPKNLEFVERRAAGKRLLDYGCATGGYSLALQKRGFTCTAIDVDAPLVERAREAGVDAHVVRPGEPIPFEDRSFDTVVLFETLEHVPDYAFVLGEARRVTRNNVVISVPNCTATPDLARASACFDHYLAEDHVNFFTREELGAALGSIFSRHEINEADYIEPALYKELFPLPLAFAFKALRRARLLRARLSYRLFAEAQR
jgi:ubiquinone/menaquinone biosynthesis C-methylase UbiE